MGKFQFKQFCVTDDNSAMKIGTDGVLLGAWAPVEGCGRIIDAGCGSGLLALMAAQRVAPVSPGCTITGIEIDPGAAADARINVAASPWSGMIEIVEGDILEITLPPRKGDTPTLIISNPPFFNEALRSPSATRALARHGSEFGVGTLIDLAARTLGPSDSLAFIAPATRDDEIELSLELLRLGIVERCSVTTRAGRPPSRMLWHVSPGAIDRRLTTLTIRDLDNRYTSQYLQLTSPFYLDRT